MNKEAAVLKELVLATLSVVSNSGLRADVKDRAVEHLGEAVNALASLAGDGFQKSVGEMKPR